MAARTAVLAVVVLAALAAVATAANECTFKPEGIGATFDLSPLESDRGYYVLDLYAGHNWHNYTYVFNICEDVGVVPRSGPQRDGDACDVTIGSDGEKLEGPGPAFQVANWFDGCYRLGDSATDRVFRLLDETNPARGVALTYQHGESCSNGKRRGLTIALVCDDDLKNIPNDAEEPVEETDTCEYTVIVKSAYGCPTECPVANGHLCNAHGVCGYDTDGNVAACFCNDGYTGIDCTIADSGKAHGLSAEGAVLIVACILLALVMGAVGFMYFKLRKLQVDPDAYKDMGGKFNELGQMAQ